MDEKVIMLFMLESSEQPAKSLIEVLFTDQLPATLTFISAILGIVAQLIISWHATAGSRRNEKHKNIIESMRLFYIPILHILISYQANSELLRSNLKEFDLFDSNASGLSSYAPYYNQMQENIIQLAEFPIDSYYSINKKLHNEIMEMFSYMTGVKNILSLPPAAREEVINSMKLSRTGYNAVTLIELIKKASCQHLSG